MKTKTLLRNVYSISLTLILLFIIKIAEGQVCGINAGISRSICINEQLVLSGTISNLESTTPDRLWTQLSGPTAQIENPSSLRTIVTNVSPGNYVFQLSGKCIDGLMAKNLVYITVLPEPAIPLVGQDSVVCFNQQIQLNANAVNYPNIGTWTVNPNVGKFYPNENTPNAVYIDSTKTPGVKKFTWTISNGNCSKSAVKQITFSEPKLPVFAGNDTTLFCKGKCLVLNGSYPGSGSLQNGLWTVISGPNNPILSNAVKWNSKICNLVPGNYVLRWTVSGTCVNQSSDINITVLNTNQPPYSIGDKLYTDVCESPIVTTQVIEGAPRANGDSVIWEQIAGGSAAIISPDINQSRITVSNLTGRFPYKFNYTQISAEGCEVTKLHTIYRSEPITGLTQPEDVVLPCNVTETLIEIAFDKPRILAASANRRGIFVSGPTDTGTVVRMTSAITNLTYIDKWYIKGLGAAGDYIYKFEYENACGSLYRYVKITVSITPGVLNPGSDLHLPCRELVVSPIGSVLSPGIFTWTQVNGPGSAILTGENTLSPLIEGLTHGVYTFRLSNYGGPACTQKSRDMKIIVTQAPPLIATTGADAEICAGNYRLSGNFPGITESGEWTVNSPNGLQFLPDKNTPNAIVTGLNPNSIYTFTWTIKNMCGSISASQILTTGSFYSAPIANAGEDRCLPFGSPDFTLTGNSADNAIHLWKALSEGAIINDPNSANTIVNFNNGSGTYMFEYSLGSTGCTAIKDTILISVKFNTIVRAGDDVQICTDHFNDPVTLNASLEGDDLPGVWNQLSGPDTVNLSSPFNKYTSLYGLGEGNYLFSYVINGTGSCETISDSVMVSICRPPSAAFAGEDISICNANSTTSINLAGSLPEYGRGAWEIVSAPWGTGRPEISNQTNNLVTLSNLFQGEYRLRYTVTNGNICRASSDEISVFVSVEASAGEDKNECGTSIISLSGNSNTHGKWSLISGQTNILIDSTSGNTAIASGFDPNSSGSYTFKYSIPAEGNCPATFSQVNYNIYPVPSRAITQGNISLCSNVTSVLLSGNIPERGVGKWSFISGPNSPLPGLANGTTNDTILKNMVPGIYEFSYEISTNPACASSSENILILKEIEAKTGGNFRVCEDSSVSLKANVPFLGTGMWSYVSGPSSSNRISFSDINNPYSAATGLNYGTHIFKWEIPGTGNCPSTSNNIEVTIDSLISRLSAGTDTSLCQKAGNYFVLGTSEISGVNYTWSPSTLLNNGSIAQPLFYGVNNSGNYTYTLKGKRGACESYSSVNVNILPTPFANININYGNCSGLFSAAAPGRSINNPLYTWDFGSYINSPVQGIGPFLINFNSSATQRISLKVVSQDGCYSQDTIMFSPFCLVPLKLLSFDGKWVNDYSKLSWKVEDPDNTKHFELQRSFTGSDFSFVELINSNEYKEEYGFNDYDNKLKFYQNIYYRLKLVDYNNEFKYSDVVLLKNNKVENVKIGPNPFQDYIAIRLNYAGSQESSQIKIYNSTGKLMLSKSVLINSGENEIKMESLGNFATGTYFLKLITSQKTRSFKIIKN